MVDMLLRMNFQQWLALLVTLALAAMLVSVRPIALEADNATDGPENIKIAPPMPAIDADADLKRLENAGFYSPPKDEAPVKTPVQRRVIQEKPPRPTIIKLIDGQYGAYFASPRNNNSPQSERFALKQVGDVIEGWKIVAISPSEVTYQKNGQKNILRLFDSGRKK